MSLLNIKQYPKSRELFKKFVYKLLLGWSQMAENTESDIQESDVDGTLDGLLWSNPRILYDFFDKQNVIIILKENWTFEIDGELYSKGCNSRQSAENEAFKQAFEILEKQTK